MSRYESVLDPQKEKFILYIYWRIQQLCAHAAGAGTAGNVILTKAEKLSAALFMTIKYWGGPESGLMYALR